MKPLILSIFITVLSAGLAFAQSTITLDDFQVSAESAVERPGEMESCILDQSNCANSEFKTGAEFSLDDVVNLGIIDREEAARARHAEGAPASQDPLPSIDIEVLFEYDSDVISGNEFPKLSDVISTLNRSSFDSFKFVLIGHTDAKGSARYNDALSQRRAEAVASHLRQYGGIDARRLITRGLGFSQLKMPDAPFAAQNRRVQLVLLPTQ